MKIVQLAPLLVALVVCSGASAPVDLETDACPDHTIERTHSTMVLSTSLGYLSIACWVIVTLPQLYINWKTGSAEAIAVGLLFCWVSGDIFNLIGCFLVHQLLTQKILAAFYVFADFVLIGQMVYYIKISPPKTDDTLKDEESNGNNDNNYYINSAGYNTYEGGACSPGKRPRSGSNLQVAGAALVTTLQSGAVQALSNPSTTNTMATAAAITTLVVADTDCNTPNHVISVVGLVMAWASAALYLSSRIPQIYKNSQRKSVEGLSLGMFALAVGGNLTYSLSIYLGNGDPADNLPYLVGSTGTMLFDFVVFGQFWLYRKKDDGKGEYENIPDEQ